MRTTLRFGWVVSIVAAVACDGPPPAVDGGPGADAGRDGGGASCAGAADGTACGSELHCVGEACVAKACGDGFLDEAAGELCDDGNETAFDGCEPGTCAFTCDSNDDCDDANACTGTDTCTAEHVCSPGTPPAEGSDCTQTGGAAGVCRTGACVDAGCGNGVTDGAEECDDGNEVDGDGCDVDCTFSCEEDLDCADGDVCDGDETCDTTTHACVAGTALDCSDGNECTNDVCDPIGGCSNPLIDMDGDGHAPDSFACGTDCDDADATAFDGAEELCDGVDNDCNGINDDGAPTWYVDCDRDGYAGSLVGASPVPSCEPPSVAPGCAGGTWTSRRPFDGATTDCNDANADVFPGQTAFFTSPIPGAPTATRYDYDCSGGHTRQYGCVPNNQSCGSSCGGGYANRSDTNPNGCTFLCLIGGSCFVYEYPDCGQSATYNSCFPFRTFCLSSPASTVQGCR